LIAGTSIASITIWLLGCSPTAILPSGAFPQIYKNWQKTACFQQVVDAARFPCAWTGRYFRGTLKAPSTHMRRVKMTLAAHLAELSEKHRLLERKIQEELSRPGGDDTQITRWKLEKLKLKDEMAKLQSGHTQH
jgi:hypothetical protein